MIRLTLVGACVAVGTLAYMIYTAKPVIEKCSKVKTVGGCDRLGQCGVILENGREQISYYPVVGKTICYHKEVE